MFQFCLVLLLVLTIVEVIEAAASYQDAAPYQYIAPVIKFVSFVSASSDIINTGPPTALQGCIGQSAMSPSALCLYVHVTLYVYIDT